MFWFIVVILVGVAAWVRFSIWRIESGQVGLDMANSRVYQPGFRFVPKFFGRLLKVSPQYKIDFATITAYSGEVSGYKSQPLTAAVTLYLKFPQNALLRDIIQGGMPTSQEKLLNFFDPMVSEETKEAISQLSWKEAVTRTETIKYLIECGLAARGVVANFVAYGGTFEIAVEEVSLPDALKQALACHDQMSIGSEAVKIVAASNAPQPRNRSFISGQVFDGQTIKSLNLVGEAPDSRALGQMYAAASRMVQKENGQQGKGKGKGGVPDNFKVEDATIT